MLRIIIVLGAPNDDKGRLSSIAVERCIVALDVFEQNPGSSILPTGGFGPYFNRSLKTHAFYAASFLVAKGVPPEYILEGVHSRFTLEDAELSKPIVDKYAATNIIVVTSDFHLVRAKLIFDRVFGGYRLTYQGSETHLPRQRLAALVEHERRAIDALRS